MNVGAEVEPVDPPHNGSYLGPHSTPRPACKYSYNKVSFELIMIRILIRKYC